jgi:ribosomal protein S18 acetylase RimI-like enzyme
MKLHIREFDFHQDFETVQLLWKNAGAGIQLRRSDDPEEIWKKLLRDPDLFLVACLDETIVGTVIGGFDGRRGLIYHLAVVQGQREHGIGSQLMDEVEHRLRAKGCIRSYLLVTRENESAMRFYEKRGWQAMDGVQVYAKDL